MKGFNVVETKEKVLAQLYKTVIVDLDKNNRVLKLDTGGWITMSTAKGMNKVIREYGLNVIRRKGMLYLVQNNVELQFNQTLKVNF